jgi:hypothetical protein
MTLAHRRARRERAEYQRLGHVQPWRQCLSEALKWMWEITPMSQAEKPNTTNPSRRALLAGAPAVAAAALAAETAATGLATAMAAPDPVFEVIRAHKAATHAWSKLQTA